MRFLPILFASTITVASTNLALAHSDDYHPESGQVRKRVFESRTTPELPPCPAGVTHVGWNDFFVSPVGREGLELTPKIKSLNGKRVRLFGYMARREEPLPGVLILTPTPSSVEEHESGFADLPPQAVRVLLPYAAAQQIPFSARPLLLTGMLSVGRREEPGESASGAVSWFRLVLDRPEPVKRQRNSKKIPVRRAAPKQSI